MSHMHESSVGQRWAGFGLTVTVSKCDATRASLRLAGELDSASAPLLGACLEYHLDMGRHSVRADLSGLGFIDTSGLEILAEARQSFSNRHATLILTGLNARTGRLVHLVGLDTVLLAVAKTAELPAPVG
jgi:anti-sigma B factor antagonist